MINRGLSAPSQPQTPLWQKLLAPMLLVSLGLHGLMLLVPTGASQDEVIPPPDPEQDSVAITRLPTSAPADPDGDDATTASRPPVGQTPPGQSATAPLGGIARIQRSSAGSSTGFSVGSSSVSRTTPNRAPSRTIPRQSGRSSNASRSQTSAPAQGSSSRTDRASSSATASNPRSATQPSANPSANQSANPSAAIGSAPPTSSQPLAPSDVRAQLQAHAAALNLPQSRIDRLATAIRERFGYNATASAEDILPINQAQWQALIRQDTGVADLTPTALPDPMPLVYRQRACMTPAPGPVKVGMVANPDGSHHGDLVVLQSSGYGAVDEKALKTVLEQNFPAADAVRAYVLTVEPQVDAGHTPCLAPNAT